MLASVAFVAVACLLVVDSGASPVKRSATSFVEFFPGDAELPVILSAPHGGTLTPSVIRDRTAGCYVNGGCVWEQDCGTPNTRRCRATTVSDMNTKQLAMEIREELYNLTGKWAALVVNNLHRRKLDPNRDRAQATFGNTVAEEAYDEYMSFIADAKQTIGAENRGLFIDIHGHGHAIARAELGYLITKTDLNNDDINPDESSLRSLYNRRPQIGIVNLYIAGSSFGAFLEEEVFPAIPSPSSPRPGNDPYFRGGFLTRTCGSVNGGNIDAIQIESARVHRVNPVRASYAVAVGRAVFRFMRTHYGLNLHENNIC